MVHGEQPLLLVKSDTLNSEKAQGRSRANLLHKTLCPVILPILWESIIKFNLKKHLSLGTMSYEANIIDNDKINIASGTKKV